ncbi:MAG: hypothetical protein HY809_01120 [Nitrospirae bacterium]|nr:hypothetical protein [Nitrospirota bacterium]
MKKNKLTSFLFLACVLILTGCTSLLPSSKTTTESPWETFDDAKKNFDRILPYKTKNEDLKALSFHPYATENVEILTYLDIIQRFMPNPSREMKDLDQGLQDCLKFKELCYAYEINILNMKTKRFGNVILDLFSFRRKREDYGWNFKALIVLNEDLVIYKLWGGKPNTHEFHENNKPLGPLQESESILRGVVPTP